MNPLASALAQWAEMLANGGLALDPEAQRRLAKLDGRAIQFESSWGPLTLEITGTRVRVLARSVDQPDAIVQGTPANLLNAMLGAPTKGLRIDGDDALVEAFVELVKGLRPDLGAPLAGMLDNDAANTLVGFLELGARAAGRFARTLAEDGTRAASAAARRGFLDRASLDEFAARIIDSQLALDRVAARIERLETTRGPAS